MTSAAPIDLGRYDRACEVQGPRAYEVRTGRRYLHGLEDGEIRHWPEYHLFIIDERTGSVMIEGGYGTFSYGWPSFGRGEISLHAFLYDIDFDYFMGKASKQPHRVFDHAATIRDMRKAVIESRRWGEMTKDEARRVWEDVGELDRDFYDERAFCDHLYNGCYPETYARFACDGAFLTSKDHPGMRRFWDEVWSVFRREVLKPHWKEHLAAMEARKAA